MCGLLEEVLRQMIFKLFHLEIWFIRDYDCTGLQVSISSLDVQELTWMELEIMYALFTLKHQFKNNYICAHEMHEYWKEVSWQFHTKRKIL